MQPRGHGSALDGPRSLEVLGTGTGEVVLAMGADAVSDKTARGFPAPERRDRHTQHLGSLSDPHQPTHDAKVRTHSDRLQANCISPIRVVSRDGDRQGDDAGEYGQHDEAGGRAGIDLRLRMDRKPAPASQSHSAMSKTSRAGCVERSRSVREPPSAVGYRHVT